MNATFDQPPATLAELQADARLARVTLLDYPTLTRLLGVSRRYAERQAALAEAGHGDFPRPIRLSRKAVRFRLPDVERYVAKLAGERRP